MAEYRGEVEKKYEEMKEFLGNLPGVYSDKSGEENFKRAIHRLRKVLESRVYEKEPLTPKCDCVITSEFITQEETERKVRNADDDIPDKEMATLENTTKDAFMPRKAADGGLKKKTGP